MKQTKRGLLRLVLTALIVATILTALGISTSAYNSSEVNVSNADPDKFRNVYVGQKLSYPVESSYRSETNDYDSYDYRYDLPEDVTTAYSEYFYFTKPGKYVVKATYQINMTHGRSSTWYYYDVKERNSIEGNIYISGSTELYAGRIVPTFTAAENAPYTIRRAYFESEGAAFESGDVIPESRAGVEVTLRIEVEPKEGYEFDLQDPSKYWSPIPNAVFINDTYVSDADANDTLFQTLNVDIPVTIQKYDAPVETEPSGYNYYEGEYYNFYDYLDSLTTDHQYSQILDVQKKNNLNYAFDQYRYVMVNGKPASEKITVDENTTLLFKEPRLYKIDAIYPKNGTIYRTFYIDILERIKIYEDINITTSNIINGQKFTEPTNGAGKKCYVYDCTATIDGKKYKIGDVINSPDGSEVNIRLCLRPFSGYRFYSTDEGTYIGKVYCDGKEVTATREYDETTGVELLVINYKTTQGDTAPVKNIEITDFDPPAYNAKPLETYAKSSIGYVTGITYWVNGNQVYEVNGGEDVTIEITVELPKGKAFASDATAVWNSQKSINTIQEDGMGSGERIFVFKSKATLDPKKAISLAGFEIDIPEIGKKLPTTAISLSDGLKDAAISWTPDDTGAKKGIEYTAKISLELLDGYYFSDNFETKGNFIVNGKPAKLIIERKIVGRLSNRQVIKVYSLEYTFEPLKETFDIGLNYSESVINAKVSDKITITANTNIDPMLATKLNVQWYKSTSPVYGSGTAIKGADSPVLTFTADLIGTRYYYCVFDVEIDGQVGTSKPQVVKVDITSGGDFSIIANNNYSSVITYKDSDDFSLEVTPLNADEENVKYTWYACDAEGNITDNTILGNGRALLMNGIQNSDAYRVFYYKCIATNGKQSDSVVFSVSLRDKKIDETKLPFTDVKDTDKFYDSVKYVYAHEPMLMNGTSGTTFDPDGALTRAAIVTVLYRLEGSPKVSGSTGFTDVPAGEWYSDAVIWAVKEGITNGYGDGIFAPDDAITREQLATFLYRYVNYKKFKMASGEKLNSKDAAMVSDWALDSMKWAVSLGVVEEVSKGTLVPTEDAARHMIATALMRVCVEYSI